MISTYQEARALLNGRATKKLANNTYARVLDDGSVAIALHGTDVVTWEPDGKCILRSGGWNTSTTRDRIQTYGPVRTCQRKGVFYISPMDNWELFPFENGMVIENGVISVPDGCPTKENAE